MHSEVIKVLFVDDERHNLLSFSANFRREFQVYIAISPVEGRRILQQNEIPIVIADYRMPMEDGVTFLSSVKALYPDTIRILLTAYADIEAVVNAINKGRVHSYLTKPWGSDQLEAAIRNGFEDYKRQHEKDKKLAEQYVEIQQLKERINHEYTYYKIHMQENLRTAIKQYLVFFKDYVYQLKREDIHFEVRSVPGGIEIELSKHDDHGRTSAYLAEYLSHLQTVSQQHIDLVIDEENILKKELMETRMKMEIRHLQNLLDIEKVKSTYFKETLENLGRLLDPDPQHVLHLGNGATV